MARLELLFGSTRKGLTLDQQGSGSLCGGRPSPLAFPMVCTILTGYRQWRDATGTIVKETSRLLLMWYGARGRFRTAYAPELNSVENIWDYLRSNFLSHCGLVEATYEAILDACCDAWNALMAKSEVIVSIGTREWAQVTI